MSPPPRNRRQESALSGVQFVRGMRFLAMDFGFLQWISVSCNGFRGGRRGGCEHAGESSGRWDAHTL
eukprot:2421793-Rhodomonas_salina.1